MVSSTPRNPLLRKEYWLSVAGRWSWLLIGITFLALYASTATRGFVVGSVAESDSMELQRAAVYLGVAHSPGYPLYVLLAHGFSRIGVVVGEDPFTWVTYFSGLTVALSILVLYRLLRLWFRWPAALAACCIYGFSGMVWHIATIAEVQGLHLLIIVSILALFALYVRKPEKTGYVEAIAALVGLGLANHRTTLLIALPIGVALLVMLLRRRTNLGTFVRIAAMGLAPLLLYFYIIYEAAGVNLYGQTTVFGFGTVYDHLSSPYSVIQLILGYGQGGLIVFPTTSADFLARFSLVWNGLIDSISVVGIVLGALGFALFFRKDRPFALILVVSAVIDFAFIMAWRADKAFVYVTPMVLMLAAGTAAVADPILNVKLPGIKLPNRWQRFPLALLPTLLALALLIIQFPQNNRSQMTDGAQIYSSYLCTEPNSIVFTGGYGPDEFIGLEAKRLRNDLNLNPTMEWSEIVDAAASSGRPVYVTSLTQRFLGMFAGEMFLPDRNLALSAALSNFVQVRPHADASLIQAAQQVTRFDQVVVPNIRLFSYYAFPVAEGMQFVIYWKADADITVTYKPYLHLRLLDNDGNVVGLLSQRDYPNPVENFYPTRYWKKGEIVQDAYLVTWPKSPLPPADLLRWTFGFTDDAGQRIGEVNIPYSAATESNHGGSFVRCDGVY